MSPSLAPSSSSAPSLHLQGAERVFGVQRALWPVDLVFEPGERIALVGPSGSGKSTLLRLLGGSLRSSAGTVLVDGVDITMFSEGDLRAHRGRCGLMEQGNRLVPQATVHDNVLAGLLPQWSWARTVLSLVTTLDREKVADVLRPLDLADRQFDKVSELSGGQQQRVAIARGLMGQSTLLLADEPISALDPSLAEGVVQLLVERAKEQKATLIVSTHHLSQVRAHVDRIVGLREGRVHFDLPTSDVTEETLDALYEGSGERR